MKSIVGNNGTQLFSPLPLALARDEKMSCRRGEEGKATRTHRVTMGVRAGSVLVSSLVLSPESVPEAGASPPPPPPAAEPPSAVNGTHMGENVIQALYKRYTEQVRRLTQSLLIRDVGHDCRNAGPNIEPTLKDHSAAMKPLNFR